MKTIEISKKNDNPKPFYDIHKGRFQTLVRKSIKFWNFDKMFGASYFSSKITPTARIWVAYTLRRRRYSQKTFVKYPEGKVPQKMKNLKNFYHHQNQHKKLSTGYFFQSNPICNSRDIGHVLFFGHQRF